MLSTNGPEETRHCGHCERDVPAGNYTLHLAHCKRNLERCTSCGEMVAKSRAEEHFEEMHAMGTCALCGLELERRQLTSHGENECSQRLLHCDYCDLDKPAAAMPEHVKVCGSRTDWCDVCSKWVKKNEWEAHGMGHQDGSMRLSEEALASPVVPPAETCASSARGEPRGTSSGLGAQIIIISIALGAAIVVGSLVARVRRTG